MGWEAAAPVFLLGPEAQRHFLPEASLPRALPSHWPPGYFPTSVADLSLH